MSSRTPMDAIIAWIDAFPAEEIGRWLGHAAVRWPLVALAVLAVIVGVAVRDVRRLRAADVQERSASAERAPRPR